MQPQPLQDAAIGLAAGLILMFLLVALFEGVSNRPTSVEHVQEVLGMEVMALVPRFSHRTRSTETRSSAPDVYHMICASLNVAQAAQPFKLLMFTSALAGEGKSTIASNVAMILAATGKQVLLLDFNIYQPCLAQQFHLKSQVGLTNLLARNSQRLPLEQYCQKTPFAGLHVLTTGSHQMDPSAFLRALAQVQFFPRLKQLPFDYVLFDAPPLLSVAETQVLAASSETLVLVMNGSRTPCRVLTKTRQLLSRMQTTRVLGCVVNQSLWRDYAETYPSLSTQSPTPGPLSPEMEETTIELPTLLMQKVPAPDSLAARYRHAGPDTGETALAEMPTLVMPQMPASPPVVETRRSCLPDTGETVQVGSGTSGPIIRPTISISGLTMSTNGLTGRAFSEDIHTPLPPSLENMSS
jgi:capsular exopolysaccharide synthesis family protein